MAGAENRELLEMGLRKTRESFFSRLSRIFLGKTVAVREEILDHLEEVLLAADVGSQTTLELLERVEKRLNQKKDIDFASVKNLLKEEMMNMLKDSTAGQFTDFTSDLPHRPYVIMVVGVNGVGKTTTIGKLAYRFTQGGKKVLLGAADTFRAAAIEQLSIWAQRCGVDIIKKQTGADPASVAYDTMQAAVSRQAEVVIIDTAGRLHNKVNLMNELSKIKRIIQKVVPSAPHETLLVLDATTGQNAFEQTRQFAAATSVNAIALTKLDGTARGGVVIGISHQFNIPVRYIGVGEKIEALQLFDKTSFINAFFES